MIIISNRKFRENMVDYLKKAQTEDVIITTLRYGNFRLVPIIEGEPRAVEKTQDQVIEAAVTKAHSSPAKTVTEEVKGHAYQEDFIPDTTEEKTEEEKPVFKYRDLTGTGMPSPKVELQVKHIDVMPLENAENNVQPVHPEEQAYGKIETKPTNDGVKAQEANVIVDPALYDAFPEQYAKELEEERRALESVRNKGLKGFFRNLGKK